jgi:aquaporin Z
MNDTKKLAAEAIGTFALVFAGIGSAVIAAGVPNVGIGFMGVGLAVGLSVMAGAYAFGTTSGAHFNPAVTLGLALAGRFEWRELPGYWLAQLVGGAIGAALLYAVASGKTGFTLGNFASNGYGALSPGGYSLNSVLIVETALTALFVVIILGSTAKKAPAGFAPIAIGLGLTLIHLMSIPVSNTSVNPARSTATAIFAQGEALMQLWVFWAAPLVGAAVGALIWRHVLTNNGR